jgi:hypothetical protein
MAGNRKEMFEEAICETKQRNRAQEDQTILKG